MKDFNGKNKLGISNNSIAGCYLRTINPSHKDSLLKEKT